MSKFVWNSKNSILLSKLKQKQHKLKQAEIQEKLGYAITSNMNATKEELKLEIGDPVKTSNLRNAFPERETTT